MKTTLKMKTMNIKNITNCIFKTEKSFSALPLRLMAGSAEFFGGLLLVVGFVTRPTSFVLAITMLVAIFAVHIDNGLFMSNNGYEFGLALFAISVSLIFSGAGKLSLDSLVAQRLANS